MTREEAIKEIKFWDFLNEKETEATEILIPELRESEDERIIKHLIARLKPLAENDGIFDYLITKDKVLAYLEKQKAKKRLDRMAPIYNDKESFESALEKAWKYYNESASRTVDSFEDDYIECVFSKGFREGFLYKEKQKELTKENVIKELEREFYACSTIPKWFHKTVQDAIYIGKAEAFREIQKEYDRIREKEIEDIDYGIAIEEWEKQKEQKLAECNEKHIANIFEKVGLAKIAREQRNDELTNALQDAMLELSKVENAEWSEEDEKRIKQLIYDTEFVKAHYEKRKEELGEQFNNILIEDCDEQIAWLKSLRPQQKCQGTYNRVVHTIFEMLKGKDFYGIPTSSCVSLLNDIRVKCKDAIECAPILDEPSWKPSEEQLEHLKRCFSHGEPHLPMPNQHVLESLYNDLQKLL